MAETRVDLWHGDCLKVMPQLQRDSIDMVFADLPYGTTRNSWDSQLPLPLFWPSTRKCTKPSSAVVMTSSQPFTTSLVASNQEHFRYEMIWEKGSATGFLNAKKQPLRAHENILVFGKKKGTYNAIRVAHHGPKKRYRTHSSTSNYGDFKKLIWECNGTRLPRSVLRFSSRDTYCGNTRTTHATQKPLALLVWLVSTYTNPGETVLDPCSGSATTAIAAIRTGRSAVCIEKDRVYFEAGVARVQNEIETTGADVKLVIHG